MLEERWNLEVNKMFEILTIEDSVFYNKIVNFINSL